MAALTVILVDRDTSAARSHSGAVRTSLGLAAEGGDAAAPLAPQA